MNFWRPSGPVEAAKLSPARARHPARSSARTEWKPVHPLLRAVSLLLVFALTLTGPAAQGATTEYVLINNDGSFTPSASAFTGGKDLRIVPGSFATTASTGTFTLALPTGGTLSSGTILTVQNLIFDGTYRVSFVFNGSLGGAESTGTFSSGTFAYLYGTSTKLDGSAVSLDAFSVTPGMSLSSSVSSGLKPADGATIATINAVNFNTDPKSLTISGTLTTTPTTTTVFTASQQSVGLVDVDINLTELNRINLLNKGSLTLVNGLRIGADELFPTGPTDGVIISSSGTINLFSSSTRGAQLGSSAFATRVDSGTTSLATLTVNAASNMTVDGTYMSQAYLEVGSGIAIKKNGGGFLRISVPTSDRSSFNSSITAYEGAVLLADGVSGTSLNASGTSPTWIAFEGTHSFTSVNISSSATNLGLATTTPDGLTFVGSTSNPHVLSIDASQDTESVIKGFVKNNVFDDPLDTTGMFSILKKGLGALTLDNDNIFGGKLLLEQGTLNLTRDSKYTDSTDDYGSPIRVMTSSPFGIGNVVLTGTSATVRLTLVRPDGEEDPSTIVLGNNLSLFSENDTGAVYRTLTFSSGTLAANGAVHNLTVTGTIDATPSGDPYAPVTSGTVVFNVVSPVTFSGPLVGGKADLSIPVVLEKQGPSTLTLAGEGGYYGDFRVRQGMLTIGNPLALVDASGSAFMNSLSVLSEGVLDLGGITPQMPMIFYDNNGIPLNPDGIPLSLSGNGTGNGALVNISDRIEANYGGSVTLAGATTIGGADGGGNIVLSGTFSGAFPLTKVGDNTLKLTGRNLSTGSIDVQSGILQIGDASSAGAYGRLGTGSVSLSSTNASLALYRADDYGNLGNTVSGVGGISVLGGTFTLTGNNQNFSGATSVSGGTLRLGGTSALGKTSGITVSSGAVLDLNGTYGAASALASVVSLNGGALLNQNLSSAATLSGSLLLGGNVTSSFGGDGSLNLSGTVSGSAAILEKVGAGKASLTGGNVQVGTFRVSLGTLQIGVGTNAGALGATPVDIGTLGTLAFNRIGESSYSGSLSGSGGLSVQSGTLRVSAVSNGFSGSVSVSGGSLVLQSAGIFPSAKSLLVTGGSFTGSDFSTSGTLTIGAGGAAQFIGSGALSFGPVSNSGINANALLFSSTAGTITLASLSGVGNTVFQGNAVVASGSISAGVVNVARSLTADISGGSIAAGTLLSASVTGGTVSAGSATVSAFNGGTLTTTGSANLTTFNGGTLNLKGATSSIGTLNGTSESRVVLGLGNTLSIFSGTSAAVLSGSGALVKEGAGSLYLSGNNTFYGATTVNTGSFVAASLSLANTSGITVGGTAFLQVADYNPVASLSVASGATAQITGTGNFGSVSNANSVLFSNTAGTVTLAGLSGVGSTRFASNATINGASLSTGTLDVTGLLTANIAGGMIRAGSLSVGTLSGGMVAASGAASITSVTAGSLTVGGSAQLTTVSGGSLNLNGSTSAITTLSGGSLNLGSGLVLSVVGGTTAGMLSGSGNLNKTGSLQLTLTGANTFTGTTSVSAGTLSAGAGALDTTSAIMVNGGSLLVASIYNLGAALTVASAGSATISGAGLTISGSVSNSNTAANSLWFNASSGTITLGTLTGNGSTRFGSNLALPGTLSAGNVLVSGSATVGNLAGGSLVVSGGTALLTGMTGGSLTMSAGSASLLTMSGGYLTLNGSDNSITTLNDGTINIGSGKDLSVWGGTFASTGWLIGSGSLNKTGSDILSLAGASSSFTGNTVIKAGSLRFTGNGLVAGPVSVGVGGMLYFDSTTDRTFAGALSGGGSVIKTNTNTVTLGSAASFSGSTTVNAGTLALAGSFGTSAGSVPSVSLANSAASLLLTTGTYQFNGAVSGTGTTFLRGTSDASRLVLTLGPNANLGANVSIEQFATLTIGSSDNFAGSFTLNGGSLIFSGTGTFSNSSTKLTINTGQVDLNGLRPTVGSLVLNGGSILSSGSFATITADTIKGGTSTSVVSGSGSATSYVNNAGVVQGSIIEFIDPMTPATGIRLTSGALKNFASGTLSGGGTWTTVGGTLGFVTGTYTTVEARAGAAGLGLTFDQAVVATGSVIASVNTGSAYTLAIQAPVTAQVLDIQNGVTATFASAGTFSSGMLRIGGNVNLGADKSFQQVALVGGTLAGGYIATFGSLTATSGTLSTKLAGSGTITQTGPGQLWISGVNDGFSGSLVISAGTVTLGNAAALGNDNGRVNAGTGGLLQLNGKAVTLVSLLGSGTVENGAGTPSTLTLSPESSATLSATLRDGSTGKLQVSKVGTQTLTVASNQFYTGDTTIWQGSFVLASGASLSSDKMILTGGTLDLGGNNQSFTFFELSGGSVANGTLSVSNAYTLTSGVVNADAILGGGAALTVNAANKIVTINSASTYTGVTTLSNGTLSLGQNGTLGSVGLVTISGGSLSLGNSKQTLSNVVLTGGAITGGTITSGTLFNFQNGTAGTVLGGSAKLTKTGAGAVTLSAANTYTGGTDITSGLLTAAVDGALPSGGSLTLSTGGTLSLGTTLQTPGSVTVTGGSLWGGTLQASSYAFNGLAGTVTNVSTALQGGSASLTIGGGTVVLTGTATYGGGTTVNAGSLVLGVANALLSTGSVNLGGGELSLGTISQTVGTFTLDGGRLSGTGSLNASAFLVKAGTVSAILAGSSALTKSGSGTVTLSGVNVYTGTTQVSGGTLSAGAGALSQSGSLWIDGGSLAATDFKSGASLTLASGSASASFSAAGGTLGDVTNANAAADSLLFSANSGTITLSSLSGAGSTRFASNASLTNGGVSEGSVTVAGSLAAQSVSGGSVTVGGLASVGTVSGGTLALNGASSSITTLNGGKLILAGNDVLTVSQGASAGVISGGGSLVKAGSGLLTLSGTNTYTGATTVSAGTLAGSAGAFGATSGITVNGGSLSVVDYNAGAFLNVGASGLATISGTGLSIAGSLTNANTAADSVFFNNATGTITLGSLYGIGSTRFAGNATITSGSIKEGSVDVAGLLTASISGGQVSAGSLVSGLVSGGSVTSAGSANLTTVSGGILNLNGASSTITTLNGGSLFLGGAGSLTVSQGVTAGSISGAGALVKVGAGSLVLSGTNAYTGATTVGAGVLYTSVSGALGSTAGITVSGGTLNALDYNPAASLNVGSAGMATIRGSGLTLSNALTNANTTTDSVWFSADSGTITLGSLYGAGSTRFGSHATIASGSISDGFVNVRGLLTGSISGGQVSVGSLVSALVSGGSVTSAGSAVLTTVSGGTLNLNGAFSTIATLNGGSLNLGAGDVLTVSQGSTAGTISGSGSLVKAGSGQLTLSGANTYAGTTTLRAGTLSVSGRIGAGTLFLGDALTASSDAPTALFAADNTSAISVGSGAYTATLGGVNTSGTVALKGATTLNSGSANLVLQAATGGTVDFQGAWITNNKSVTVGSSGNAGVVKLSSAFLTTGTLSITNGGSLLVGTNSVFSGSVNGSLLQSALLVSGSTLDLGAYNTSSGKLTLSNGNLVGTGTISASSYEALGDNTVAAVLGGAGAFSKTGAGTLTISTASTAYTGTLTVAQGSVAFTQSGVVGGTIKNSGTLWFNNSADTSLAGLVTGSGSLIKEGTSNLSLLQSPTYTGATTINAGSLTVNGLLASGSITNNASLVFNLNSGEATLSGSLWGTGSTYLVSSSPSTLVSNGSLLFGNLYLYDAVTLKLGSQAWAQGGNITLNGGTLDTYGSAVNNNITVLRGNVRLRIDSVVNPNPSNNFYTIDNNYTAVFMSNGSLSGGTLRVIGGVDLDQNAKGFGPISLEGGQLSNGTLSAGTLSADSGQISADFGAGFGTITKSGTGSLSLSGNNTAYGGTILLQQGTILLNGAWALNSGSVGLVFAGSGSEIPVLRLNGYNANLGSLSATSPNQAVVENGNALSNSTLTLSPAGAISYAGTLRDGGAGKLGVVMAGTGSVTLNGTLSYTGGTTVNAGSLSVQRLLASTGAVSVNAGTLDLAGLTQSVGAVSVSGGSLLNGVLTGTSFAVSSGYIGASLAGSADFTKTTSGNAVLSGANTLTGSLSVLGGSLALAGNGTLSSGSLVVRNLGTSVDLGGSHQNVGAVLITDATILNGVLTGTSYTLGSGTISAALDGAADLLKNSDGTLTLRGANTTLTGSVNVSQGTLVLAGAGSLGSGTLLVNSGATVNLGSTSQSVGAVSVTGGSLLNGTLTGTGFAATGGYIGAGLVGGADFIKTAGGNLVLAGTNALTGKMSVLGGSLKLAQAGTLSSGSLVVGNLGTSVDLGGTSQNVGAVYLTNATILNGTLTGMAYTLGSGTLSAALSGAATLLKNTDGLLTLSGANTLTGTVSLTGGSVLLSGAGALSSGSLSFSNGAVLDLGGLTRSTGVVTLDSGTIQNGVLAGSGYDLRSGVVGAVLAGTSDVTKSTAGLVTLSGVNTLNGTVNISAGTLALSHAQALALAAVNINGGSLVFAGTSAATLRTLSGSLTLVNAESGAVALTLSSGANTEYNDVLSGAGSLVKAGSGQLTLGGVNTYTGTTTVAAGSLLAGAGSLFATSGIIVSGGTLSVVDYNAAASLEVGVLGRAVISGAGLTITGSVTNANTAADSVLFGATSGVITVGSLYGAGSTRFANDAVISSGSISNGLVTVVGSLNAAISGGQVSAGSLVSALVSGGSVTSAGSANVAAVSGGILKLNGAYNTVTMLNGGSLTLGDGSLLAVSQGLSAGSISGGGSLVKVDAGQLTLSGTNNYTGATTVQAGTLTTTVSGALGSTSGITVSGGSLNVLDYNGAASLKVGAGGTATVRGTGLTFSGSLTNANTAADSVFFSGTSGTISLGSLYGVGSTRFASNAFIAGGNITEGVLAVANTLMLAGSVEAGVVQAGSLAAQSVLGGSVTLSGGANIGSLSGGTLTVGGVATFATVSGGTLRLNGPAASITSALTGGQIILGGTSAGSALLMVSQGTSAELLGGTGTLVKSGSGTLNLSAGLGADLALRVDGGTLTTVNILSDSRSISVASGGTLALTLAAGSFDYSGSLAQNAGMIALYGSGAGSQLVVGGSSAFLDGGFTLGNLLTLDVSRPEFNIFGDRAKVTFLDGGSLTIGGFGQEMWIQELNTRGAGTFTISGTGGKILFDTQPTFLNDSNEVIGSSGVVISGSVSFDYLTKGGALDQAGGVYRYTAGTVRDTAGTSSPGGILTGTRLELEPQYAQTTIYLKRQAVNFTEKIVAGGSDHFGTISIGTIAYTPELDIESGVRVLLDTAGQLLAGTAEAGATRILNAGTLEVVGAAGSKEIANVISGTGVLTKTGEGILRFTGDNIGFGGVTNLNAGTFIAGSKTALGTSTLNFKGGSLGFTSGLGSVSVAGAVNLQGVAAAPIDTGDNTIQFAGNISGANTLTKTGSGIMVLAGTNTAYTGDIVVQQGVLQIGDGATGGALSQDSDLVVASGAIMRLARSAFMTLSQTISGSGTFEQAGSGTTVLSGNNQNFTGHVVLNAGTLSLGALQALGGSLASTITFNEGVLQYGANNNTDYSNRFAAQDGQQIKVDTNGQSVTFGTTLAGNTTSLAKLGAGELVLTGVNNSYAGATTIQTGTLRLVGTQSGQSAIAVHGGRLVYEITTGTSSGSVEMAANTSTVFSVASGSPTFNGVLSGAGSVEKQGAGALTVTQSLLQTGGFTLNGGSFNLSTPVNAASKISMGGAIVLNAGSLNIRGGVVDLHSTLTGGSLATLQLGADTLFLQSVNLDSLNLQLPEGVNALTVFTNVDPTSTSSHQMVGPGSVTFKLYDARNISASDLNGIVENPADFGTLVFNANSNVTFRNPLAVTGDFQTVAGSKISFAKDITIAGAVQIYGGTVAITGGTLRATTATVEIGKAGTAATLDLSGANTAVVASKVQLSAGSITVAGNALATALQGIQTLEVGTSNGTADAAQLILGGGTGSMTLGATQTLKGSGTIQGNIRMNDASSALSPGNSPGTLKIMGSVDLQAGTLQIEVGKTKQDQIDATGQLITIGSAASLLLVDYENGALPVGRKLAPLFIGGTLTGDGKFASDHIFFMRNVGNTSVFSSMYTAEGDVNNLLITRKRFAATSGLSENARRFAMALDVRIIDKGASDERLLELGTGSSIAEAAARVPLQLAAGNPAAYAELAGLSKQRTLTLSQGLSSHFASLRAGLVDVSEGEYNLWTTGYGTWHKQNANAAVGNAGFSGNTYGDMFGVEKRFGNLVFGITGAVGSTSANFSALAGRVTTDSWHGGAYATANMGGYTLETSMMFGSTDSNAHRTISAPGMATQEGNIKMGGSEWLAHLGVAKPVVSSGSFTLTPSMRLIAQGNNLDSASEKNLGGMEVSTASQSTYSVLHELGVEARRSLKIASKPAAASLQLDWIHDYSSKGRALDMDLAGDTSSRFGYKGSDAGADALRVGAGLETAITRRTTLRISVDYQTQSKASTTHGAISLGYTF